LVSAAYSCNMMVYRSHSWVDAGSAYFLEKIG